jgi:RNA polymerase sigma-70 factor (sigma-E family)
MTSRDTEFSAFVEGRRTHLRRVAYAVCGDWHRADDILQTALLKAYLAWPKIHRQGAEEAYVRRIILRTTIDESRRPWRRERPGLPEEDRPSRTGLDHEERDALIDALQQLPEMQRKCVVLRHWLGLSVEETADELGIASGTVKSHTSRAVSRLQELLATPGRAS